MNRYLLVPLLLLSVATGLHAQEQGRVRSRIPEGRRFEVEIAAGTTFGYAPLEGLRNAPAGVCAAIEGRYNFRRIPFDVGLRIDAAIYSRRGGGCSPNLFLTGDVLAVADYNLSIVRGLVLFAGAGAGVAGFSYTVESVKEDGVGNLEFYFCAMPRVGFECWNRLRITFGYTLTERANSRMSLTLGLAIGGGRRR